MLVLTRKRGESILVGDDITIMVLSVNASRVRLGITAPSDVGVRRQEIEIELNEAPESGDGLSTIAMDRA